MGDVEPRTGRELFDNDSALDKFMAAAEIANAALTELMAKCVVGASIAQLCQETDAAITAKCDLAYKKDKSMRKGVAFPTCISVNEIMGHYAPFDEDVDCVSCLKEGDLIKLDLGAQIDGYPAWVGHSLVVAAADSTTPIEGRRADVILAAHTAGEAAIRSIKAGATNYDVTRNMEKAYASYDCRGVHGVFSHECGKNLVDGGDHIIHNRDLVEERVDEFEFVPYQCFLLQVMASTGPGKARETKYPTTIFKRDPDNAHPMKTPLTRQFVGDFLLKAHPVFPFNARQQPDKNCRKVGLAECLRHYMVQAFPVVADAAGEFVASFTYTVILSPTGLRKLTGLPLDTSKFVSQRSVTDEALMTVLQEVFPSATKKSKGKKTPAASAVETSSAAAEPAEATHQT